MFTNKKIVILSKSKNIDKVKKRMILKINKNLAF